MDCTLPALLYDLVPQGAGRRFLLGELNLSDGPDGDFPNHESDNASIMPRRTPPTREEQNALRRALLRADQLFGLWVGFVPIRRN